MYLFSLKWSKPSLDDKNSILGIGHMCTVLWNLDYKKSLIFSFFFHIFEKESNLSSCLLSLARSLKSISFEGYGREMEKVPFLVQTYQYARSLFLAWEWEGAWPSLPWVRLHLLSAAGSWRGLSCVSPFCPLQITEMPLMTALTTDRGLVLRGSQDSLLGWVPPAPTLPFPYQMVWLQRLYNWETNNAPPLVGIE